MPVPRLSKRISRAIDESRSISLTFDGTCQASSTCETNGGT
jgi:hypothetical protein